MKNFRIINICFVSSIIPLLFPDYGYGMKTH